MKTGPKCRDVCLEPEPAVCQLPPGHNDLHAEGPLTWNKDGIVPRNRIVDHPFYAPYGELQCVYCGTARDAHARQHES